MRPEYERNASRANFPKQNHYEENTKRHLMHNVGDI